MVIFCNSNYRGLNVGPQKIYLYQKPHNLSNLLCKNNVTSNVLTRKKLA